MEPARPESPVTKPRPNSASPGFVRAAETPAETVRALIEEGFNNGDLSAVDRWVDPGFVEHQRLAPGVPPTIEATREIIRSLRAGFPDLRLSIEELDTVGDRVWIRMRATGTHRGPFMGQMPTGRTVELDVMDLVRVRGGRIVEHWGVPDQLALLEQLGAGTDGPAAEEPA